MLRAGAFESVVEESSCFSEIALEVREAGFFVVFSPVLSLFFLAEVEGLVLVLLAREVLFRVVLFFGSSLVISVSGLEVFFSSPGSLFFFLGNQNHSFPNLF
ncbi:MAG TPA: hypothetical protein P5560_06840 [Thermotogota bacterium]|nr:hypothetical protein [Thermotogota bacterium]